MGRYITREYLDGKNYLKTSPVFIDKMRLLYDTESLNVLLQLSIENISDKDINKITFLATTYDKNDEVVEKSLKLEINEKIGSKENLSLNNPIILEDNTVYSIDLIISSVKFSDNETWTNKTKSQGTELIKPKPINENSIIARAYEFFGYNNIQIDCQPVYTDDYWICSCRQLNDITKNSCKNCGCKLKEIKEYFSEENLEKLIEEYQTEKQKIEKEKHEQKLKDKAIRKKKTIKLIKVFTIILLIVAVITIIYALIRNELVYQSALKQYEKQNYAEVITKLKSIKGDKAKKLLNDTYYDYSIFLMGKNEYEHALVYLNKLNTNEAKEKIKECNYSLGLEYMNKDEYKTAINYFEKVGNEESKNQIKECNYQLAIDMYKSKGFEEAIKAFNSIKDYKDSNDWINKSKLGYIKDNLNINNETTREYIKDLQAINYSDINTIYNDLVKWTVKIYANNSKYGTTNSESLSKYGSIYYHIELKGGKYEEEIPIKYRIIFSDGSYSDWDKFDYNFSNGETGYVYWDYGDFNGPRGKTTIVIYNGNTNKEIGRHSVKIN